MRHIILSIFIAGLTFTLSAAEFKSFKGELDPKGQAKVAELIVNVEKPFILQAFMLYKKSWRSIPVFFNETGVWVDLGPAYRKLEYRINYFQE